MPPNTRKAPRTGAEGGESSSAALEDDLGDGDVEAWENAARDAARGQKAAMRKEHLDVLSTLRKRGKEMLERGMKQWRTEAVGDCWLISLLAGSAGFDAEQVRSFTKDQRNTFLTPWRKTLVEVAPDVDTKCFSMSREGESELLVWSAGARCGAGWPRAEARASGDG